MKVPVGNVVTYKKETLESPRITRINTTLIAELPAIYNFATQL
jgi:hypothetical protein